MTKRVLIINGGGQYRAMFETAGYEVVTDMFKADLYCFTGGADVTPEIYGEENTHSGNDLRRDIVEAGYFAIAQRMGIPCVGICRGGQFLNVMCGGKMHQHVEGHALHKGHEIWAHGEPKPVLVSSTHHQMMIPNEEGVLLGSACIVGKDDPEIVFYENQDCLCFQPHPEFNNFPECTKLFFELIEELL